VDDAARAEQARQAVRVVERFAYRAVADAVEDGEVREARKVLRLAVGLRRMLDRWKKE
jgi:hypothetical protein